MAFRRTVASVFVAALTLPLGSLVGTTRSFGAPAALATGHSGPMSFDELVGRADVVVVAKVGHVEPADGELSRREAERRGVDLRESPRVAEASVVEVWKGRPGATVRFRVARSFVPGTADPVPRETAVLFLGAPDEAGLRDVLDGGAGRMLVLAEGLARYLTFDPDYVALPMRGRPISDDDSTRPAKFDLDTFRSRTLARLQQRCTFESLVAQADLIVLAAVEEKLEGGAVRVRAESVGP